MERALSTGSHSNGFKVVIEARVMENAQASVQANNSYKALSCRTFIFDIFGTLGISGM